MAVAAENMKVGLPPRLFNVKEYYRMSELGILDEDERTELIEGVIIQMSPIGDRHASCVNTLTELLVQQAAKLTRVSVQNPIRLSNRSAPEPDLLLIKRRQDYRKNPAIAPADVILLIEVSDSTLIADRNVKLPLYARAGIPEYWIVNLPENRIEVYSEPSGNTYRNTRILLPGDTLSLAAVPDLSLSVDEILGLSGD